MFLKSGLGWWVSLSFPWFLFISQKALHDDCNHRTSSNWHYPVSNKTWEKIMPLMRNPGEPFTAPPRESKAQDTSGTWTPNPRKSWCWDPLIQPRILCQGDGSERCLQNPVSSLPMKPLPFPKAGAGAMVLAAMPISSSPFGNHEGISILWLPAWGTVAPGDVGFGATCRGHLEGCVWVYLNCLITSSELWVTALTLGRFCLVRVLNSS